MNMVKKEFFNEIECTFYKNENEENIFMTIEQLAYALGYEIEQPTT